MQREEINYLGQKTDIKKLEELYIKIDSKHKVQQLAPATQQTLLVPVKDPISNGSFYGGEVLVTSTIVQVEQTKGWAMVMDDNEEVSLYTAVLDAAFAKDVFKDEIVQLLEQTKDILVHEKNVLNQKVNSTKVNFDLL